MSSKFSVSGGWASFSFNSSMVFSVLLIWPARSFSVRLRESSLFLSSSASSSYEASVKCLLERHRVHTRLLTSFHLLLIA